MIEIRNAEFGNGVFAKKKIKKGTIIESVPYLLFSLKDTKLLEKTKFHAYGFTLDNKTFFMPYGFAMVYNHSFTPNIEWYEEDSKIHFRTLRTIMKGEELMHDYWYEEKDYFFCRKEAKEFFKQLKLKNPGKKIE